MSQWSMTLKTTRAKLGKTQTEMADILGLGGKHYICMLESGGYTFSDTIKRSLDYVNKLNELGHEF